MIKKLSITNKSSEMIKTCEKVSKVSIYLLVFLLPIFFLPWTVNVLDFNKQALLIVLVFIALFAWLLKILISGKISLNLNFFYIPVIVLFLVHLAATIFSLWRYGSFWGWPQVTEGALLSLLGLVLLYFLVVNIFRKREIFYLMILLVFSSFLAMLYGVFQLFGKFLLPFNFTKIPSFNTIGAVNDLAVFTAVLLPLLIIFLMISAKKYLRIFSIAGIVLSAVLLVLINFPAAWWLVIVGSVLVITFGTQKREIFDSRWLILPMFFLALALFFTFFKFQIPGLPDRPIEVSLTQRATFDISWQTLKERPVLGSGPGTFIYDFSKYKDISFNKNPFWNIRFNSGGSKVLTVLAATGILGALSFLALLGFFVFYGIKSLFIKTKGKLETRVSDKASGEEGLDEGLLWNLSAGIFISFIVLAVGYFLYQSNLSLNFVYFLLLAGFVSLLSPARQNFSSKNLGGPAKKEFLLKPSSLLSLAVTFAFTVVFVLGLGILILEGQRYVAEVNYFKGIVSWQQGQRTDALEYLVRTVRMAPKVDLYWQELSQVYLQNISEAAARTDLSQEEISQNIQIFINNAVNSAKVATDVNPQNVANWSVRGFIYQNLIGVVGGTKDWAVTSYEEALKLEPTNPYFPTQIGICLLKEISFLSQEETAQREKLLSEAQVQFEKAIELKSDYAPAHFQLAIVYQNQGKQLEAIRELERARTYAPEDVGLAFQLGLIYYQIKDYQKARFEFERLVLLNPNYSNALYFLGLTYDQLGEKGRAIEIFKRILALNPNNSQVKKIIENLEAGRNILAGIVEDVPPIVPIEEEYPEIEE